VRIITPEMAAAAEVRKSVGHLPGFKRIFKMNCNGSGHSSLLRLVRTLSAVICIALLISGDQSLWAIPSPQAEKEAAAKLPPEQLDSLVAPIALYPDPLLSQTLVASTYPLEIIQLQQWLEKNKGLKDKALADAAKKQGWDVSVQTMAVLPDVVKQLAENIKWTTELGNAFLAQQGDVMDSVQRMRAKANEKGNLKSNEQQKVETKVIENKQVIVIQPASPEVVYVPSYNPTVVYGAPVYPYPPVYYPPAGYYAAGMAISFGVGMMVGAAWGGGWGYGAGWGGNNNVYINHNNNNFNRNTNVQGGNRNQVNPQGGRSNWQHNPQHRGGAPYGDRSTANKFGGTTRGDSLQNRQASARQNQSRDQAGGRDRGGASAGNMDRSRQASAKDRSGASAGTMDRGNRSGSTDRGSSGFSGGGDRVGDRSVSNSGSSRNSSAFGGGGSGSSARASSSRGSSSFGGGGGSRGGGGGSRGGGGGRRR
jgi:hypothetical protein